VPDPADGGPLFSAVVPREIAYPGPFMASAPDLLLVPRDPALLLLADPRAPLWCDPGQTGIHAIDGVCLLRSRRRAALSAGTPVGIEAVAGLLLDDLGIDAPFIPRHPAEEVRAAAAFLPEGAWRTRSAPTGTVAPREQAPRAPLPPDAGLEERLRFLGYW
jgi:hypothetical protein